MSARVVLIGAGGIGAPAAIALAGAGSIDRITVVDDDLVDRTNLHRQILFDDGDVGAPKLDAFARALAARAPSMRVDRAHGRALPDTARAIVRGAGVVIDATDNFSSRFLIADACALEGVPVVHAAAVRWTATVMAVAPRGAPCYRCLFEDLPQGAAPDCATAGVVGPVCGVAGAVAADRAIRALAGDASVFGSIVTFDGKRDALREVAVRARNTCDLCGAARSIRDVDPLRYLPQTTCEEAHHAIC